ncbi:TonB-dependent receptor [Flavivirga aquatica]|nr:TonB-dependent receptor [Flavivirga aquatica]
MIFCSVCVVLLSLTIHAQNNTPLKGRVTDADTNIGISNVAIKLLATANGTLTNNDGSYSITLASIPAKLEFSILGYQPKTVIVKEQLENLNISIKKTATELSEIVISSSAEKILGTHKTSKISLQLMPISSAQDLLKTIPGLFIAQHAGGGKAEQIFLRGFDNDHGTDFAVMVDDIPANLSSHAHGQGYADLHFLIPETIKDADYYKGPHESSLGNFAVSGAAKFSSKNRLHRNLLKIEYGQYDFIRALAMVSLINEKNVLTKNNESAYIAIEGTYNKSFFNSPQNLRRLNTFTKYNVDLSNTSTLSTSISTFHSDWNASGQIPLRAVELGLINRFDAIDNQEGGDTKRIHINTQLDTKISENIRLKNQMYYVSNRYNLFSNFSFYQNNPIDGDMIHQEENRHIYAYQGSITTKKLFQINKSNTTLGWQVQHNNNKIGLNNTIGRTFRDIVNHSKIKETNYALYLKERLQATSRLTVLAGLRADYFRFNLAEIVPTPQKGDNTAFRWSPKLSLFYDFTKNFQLYAKASSGFHSNYTNAAVKNKTVHALPKAIGYDLGTEFKIGNNLIGNLATWYLESDAEFVFVADSFEFENKGRSKRIGGEASFRYQPFSYFWLDTDLNYSYGTLLDTPKAENKIPSAPRFSSTGGATLQLQNRLKGSLRYRYLGERPLIEDESVIAQDYFILDAAINYTKPSYEIGLSIENVFNQKWREAIFYDSSQLQTEANPVDDIHFTPGTPFLAKLSLTYFF